MQKYLHKLRNPAGDGVGGGGEGVEGALPLTSVQLLLTASKQESLLPGRHVRRALHGGPE